MLGRCRQINLRLNLSKYHFERGELNYHGQVLMAEGINPLAKWEASDNSSTNYKVRSVTVTRNDHISVKVLP